MFFKIPTFWILVEIKLLASPQNRANLKNNQERYKQVWDKQAQIAFIDSCLFFNNLGFEFIMSSNSHQTCFAHLSSCLTSGKFC